MPHAATPSSHRSRASLALAAAVLLAAGCAAVQPARVALPPELGAAEAVPLQGLAGPRKGNLVAGAQRGQFERSASQLSLFGQLGFGSARASYTLDGPAPVQARCSASEVQGARGVLAGAIKPLKWQCEWSDGARLTLESQRLGSALGTRDERLGRYEHQGVVIELRSLHALQGTPLPLAEPAGYLLQHQGTAVAAVELTDSTPLLRRPAAGQPLHEAATRAGIALALMWTPDGL